MSKQENPSQLPLELAHNHSLEREDLVVSAANATAVSMIDAWPDWPGSTTVLAGPVGSGKSHLASIWKGVSNAVESTAADLTKNSDMLAGAISSGNCVLIEDIGQERVDEPTLFHVLNLIRQENSFCLITSRLWPREWSLELNDLKSRVQAAQVIELHEPDDMLIKQVMVKLFADRQLQVEAHVIEYCVLRMERSLDAASRLVAEIDAQALARKSTITRTIASDALRRLDMG